MLLLKQNKTKYFCCCSNRIKQSIFVVRTNKTKHFLVRTNKTKHLVVRANKTKHSVVKTEQNKLFLNYKPAFSQQLEVYSVKRRGGQARSVRVRTRRMAHTYTYLHTHPHIQSNTAINVTLIQASDFHQCIPHKRADIILW